MVDRSKKIAALLCIRQRHSACSRLAPRLSKPDRFMVGKDIQKVEFGWPIGMPYCRPLGQGLWEVRSDLAGGRTARVIFCIADGEMVLLHGFEKKTQKTRPRDIGLALKRKREIEG
jgi:phage-related protein